MQAKLLYAKHEPKELDSKEELIYELAFADGKIENLLVKYTLYYDYDLVDVKGEENLYQKLTWIKGITEVINLKTKQKMRLPKLVEDDIKSKIEELIE